MKLRVTVWGGKLDSPWLKDFDVTIRDKVDQQYIKTEEHFSQSLVDTIVKRFDVDIDEDQYTDD